MNKKFPEATFKVIDATFNVIESSDNDVDNMWYYYKGVFYKERYRTDLIKANEAGTKKLPFSIQIIGNKADAKGKWVKYSESKLAILIYKIDQNNIY